MRLICASTAREKEQCGLVKYYFYCILHAHLLSMYEPHSRLPLALNLRNLYPLRFYQLIIFVT